MEDVAKYLPKEFIHQIFNKSDRGVVTYRSSIKNEEECETWIKSFGENTRIAWIYGKRVIAKTM